MSRKKKIPQAVIPDPNQIWFTLKEAAAYIRLSPTHLRNLIHSREIKVASIATGGSFRIERADLDQLLQRRKRFMAPYRTGSRPWIAAIHAEKREKLARRA